MADLIMSNIDSLLRMTGKTKGELEKVLGHSKGYLASKENGTKLTLEQLNTVCEFFDVDLSELTTVDLYWTSEVERLSRKVDALTRTLEEVTKELAHATEMERLTNGRM